MNNKVLITQNVKDTLTIRYKYTYTEGFFAQMPRSHRKINKDILTGR